MAVRTLYQVARQAVGPDASLEELVNWCLAEQPEELFLEGGDPDDPTYRAFLHDAFEADALEEAGELTLTDEEQRVLTRIRDVAGEALAVRNLLDRKLALRDFSAALQLRMRRPELSLLEAVALVTHPDWSSPAGR